MCGLKLLKLRDWNIYTVLQAYRVQVSHFCFFCVSLLVSLEMQAAEGRNLTDMYRHHSTSLFAVLCTYFSIHSTNFVRKMIPTFLKVKVCDSQRTFYFDQSSRSTTVQSYGKGEGHINYHKSQKFARKTKLFVP